MPEYYNDKLLKWPSIVLQVNKMPEHYNDKLSKWQWCQIPGCVHFCREVQKAKQETGNTIGGSVTVPLTSCLTGLD
jgi:hypothetical protein